MDLVVTQLIRPMELSVTRAWLVKCNDDQNYVMKFFSDINNSFDNEFLCHKIAKFMGLTIPEPAILSITKDKVDVINAIRKESNDFLISPGKYFGTKFIENSYMLDHEIHGKLKPSKIKNIHEVPGMVVFDLFVENKDRSQRNALLHVLSEEQQIFEYVLIDHHICFGGIDWNVNSMKNSQPTLKINNIPWKHNFFISDNAFKTYVEKLKNLDKEFLKGLIDEIPIEWKRKPEEYDALLIALSTRDVDEILSLLKRHKRELIISGLRKRFSCFHRFLIFVDNCKAKISKINSGLAILRLIFSL